MQHRRIPGTDLEVSLLGFGNFVFGNNWWGDFSDTEAVRLQNRAVDLGVTFFDTAPAYGKGRAENLLGRTIADVGRDRLVISTKFGYPFATAKIEQDREEGKHREREQHWTPKDVRGEVEGSLGRLGTDRIDLYQAHNVKLDAYADDLFATLEALKDEGKIRAWGVALGPAIGWREEGQEALVARGADTVQTVFNLYEQDLGLELCEAATGLGRGGVIARVPTNSGILDEEFASADHKFAPHDHRKYRDRAWLVQGLKKNQILRERFGGPLGMSLRELSTRWLASQPGLVTIEPNLLSDRDLDDFAHACDGVPLEAETLAELRALYLDDFGLGEAAHPCDFKSSVAEGGSLRAGYVEPALAADA
ncbi:aldo/keto reductase [Phycisphaera mikurensis]|uniref:Putative aldo/keto reductase n=1 Tax=Phycisphaera mikurensis (strain NBRC 102666 / KCTC 22515 / FYK2301M01) TaxID=1142394 RepID=I0IJ39_PHYMF|nr:aldo/keto reductase [Phycisphaera mikurensis]MBB6443124.1 aryl-alcohol dehydrogenase-like predicted oxidoreductase [Phycisphaera mikurensis]BAM05277.1 putative aldo/keto reductase [Phycisphaera mikurensis NBRC 102666]